MFHHHCVKMSKVQMLRGLVEQRLTAAAEEIFGLFERTIAEYEEELCRSKEENERQRERLDAVFSPQLRLHRAELPQQHVCKEEEVLSDQQINMPVIISVESEANRDHQLLSHNSHGAESQDQKGGQHGDSGSTRNAEPEPKKRRRKSRRPSNNVDNTNMSEIHPNTQTERLEQHVCKGEEVLSDQQLCIQERNSSLDREDPEPPQTEEEQEELCASQEWAQFLLKQDTLRHSNNVNSTNMSEIQRNTQTDVQQLLVVKVEFPPEQQEWSSSLDQEEPDPPHIKEEQEQFWTSQEGEHLQGLEEADIKFPFTTVPKKREDEEKVQSSQLHEKHWLSQTEENREAERTGADGEDRGGAEPVSNSDPDSSLQSATHDKTSPESETDRGDWVETMEPQSGLNSLQNIEVAVNDVGCNTGNPLVCSPECAGSFGHEEHLQKHTGIQTGGKPFSCSVCGKRCLQKKTLMSHMRLHPKEKGYTCSVCNANYSFCSNLVRHLRIHKGEKLFSCSVCSKSFTLKQSLTEHLTVHTGEKPFSCSICDRRFAQKQHLKRHFVVHRNAESWFP